MQIDRRAFISSVGGAAALAVMTADQKADALERYMQQQLDAHVTKGGAEQAHEAPVILQELAAILEQGAVTCFAQRRLGLTEFGAVPRHRAKHEEVKRGEKQKDQQRRIQERLLPPGERVQKGEGKHEEKHHQRFGGEDGGRRDEQKLSRRSAG